MNNVELTKKLDMIKNQISKDTMHELFVKYKFALTASMDPEAKEYQDKVVAMLEDEIRQRSEQPECTGDSCPIF